MSEVRHRRWSMEEDPNRDDSASQDHSSLRREYRQERGRCWKNFWQSVSVVCLFLAVATWNMPENGDSLWRYIGEHPLLFIWRTILGCIIPEIGVIIILCWIPLGLEPLVPIALLMSSYHFLGQDDVIKLFHVVQSIISK